MNRPRRVHVVNSRLPVYKLKYGNGLGKVVTKLFTRIAPKLMPVGKELASKAIGAIGKTPAAEAGKCLCHAAKDKIISLIRGKKPSKESHDNKHSKEAHVDKHVELPSTEDMPPKQLTKLTKWQKKIKYNCWFWSKIVDLDRRVQYNV